MGRSSTAKTTCGRAMRLPAVGTAAHQPPDPRGARRSLLGTDQAGNLLSPCARMSDGTTPLDKLAGARGPCQSARRRQWLCCCVTSRCLHRDGAEGGRDRRLPIVVVAMSVPTDARRAIELAEGFRHHADRRGARRRISMIFSPRRAHRVEDRSPMSPDKLVYVWRTRSARFLQVPGEGEDASAAQSVATHLRRYWDPRMRKAMAEHLASEPTPDSSRWRARRPSGPARPHPEAPARPPTPGPLAIGGGPAARHSDNNSSNFRRNSCGLSLKLTKLLKSPSRPMR